MSCSEERKDSKLFNPITNKIVVSRDVLFNEGGVYGNQKSHVEKKKSILDDDDIPNNDNEQSWFYFKIT